MEPEDFKRVWENPNHPLKTFGTRPFSRGDARSHVGDSFLEWALHEGLLIEREDGQLMLRPLSTT